MISLNIGVVENLIVSISAMDKEDVVEYR